jgi:hypothetical protein
MTHVVLFIYLFIKLRHLQQTSGRVTTTVYTNYYEPFKNCKILGLVYTACYERTEPIIISSLIARCLNQIGSLSELGSLLTVRLARRSKACRTLVARLSTPLI